MSERYVVKIAISPEVGGVCNGKRTVSNPSGGFQIYDTFESKHHPDIYMSRPEAQAECDRRNGR